MRDIFLLIHFLGLVVGAGAAFSLFVISLLAKRFDSSYKAQVLIILFPLRYVSYVGLMLLIASGLVLGWPFFSNQVFLPWFTVKLVFVSILFLLSIIGMQSMSEIKRVDPGLRPAIFQRLALLGKASVFVSVCIVICAVMSFH